MFGIIKLQDEMIEMYEVLEDKRLLEWVESLEDKKRYICTIQNIKEELLENIKYKDSFSQAIFYKWVKEIDNLLNLSGLWNDNGYRSWADLLKTCDIACSSKYLYGVDAYLYGRFVIPDTVHFIKSRTFLGCKYLTEIILPETIEFIGFGAFSDCSSLKYLKIPKSVLDLREHIVSKCTSLSLLEVPEKFKNDEAIINSFYEGDLQVQIKYY